MRSGSSIFLRRRIHAIRPFSHGSLLKDVRSSVDADHPPIGLDKVLIANRGEIACRIIRTCRAWGIPTVAVYSVADGPQAWHARMADEAYLIGDGPAPAQSYLRSEALLEIMQQSGAAAIHPGYGFLSENAAFATRVQQAGGILIGPPPSAMQAMASKSQSKALMEAAGVPTTPGYYSTQQDPGTPQEAELLRHEAQRIGYPVLIKAVMGGGGKGMRLVWQDRDFLEALASCQRESQSAFGDSTVLLEKYLVRPRHVEVQVVADTQGHCLYLYERDCSLQRRHQKIIEEAPANDLSPALRQRMGEMGTRAAQAVGYVNAGTVEFLFDTQASSSSADQNPPFYFCEMNTRLQVEHPVTEAITGIDLVEWQLRIAAGQQLPILRQEDVPCVGHAFEARIYAENPARGFVPATGLVWHHDCPPAQRLNWGLSSEGVRVDTGLPPAGQEISVHYDPMISKLIVHGPDRAQALNKLIGALKQYQIAGVTTNIDFLIRCAQHPVFQQAGGVNTGFLEDFAADVHLPATEKPSSRLPWSIGAMAALLHWEHRIGGGSPDELSPWSSRSGSWRVGGESGRARRVLHLGDADHEDTVVCVSNRDGSFQFYEASSSVMDNLEGLEPLHVQGRLDTHGNMEVVVNQVKRIKLKVVLRQENEKMLVRMWPQGLEEEYAWAVDVRNPLVPFLSNASLGGGGDGLVKSPMPGKITRINYGVGDEVALGDVIMVMEAMKMEHLIKSPMNGKLSQLRCQVQDVVQDGAVLLVVESNTNAT